jgi:membrane dipeptidase
MEHFEYIKDLCGIDHVTFGPDTVYGDHVGLHRVYSAALSIKESRSGGGGAGEGGGAGTANPPFEEVEYVAGLENPTEGSANLVRWLVKHGYSDAGIAKVMGGNVLRVLNDVWV